MPIKSIPTLGDSNWGTPLNNHLSQLLNPITGGINSFEQFSQRPTTLTADDNGKTYLYTQTGNIHQWTGTNWKVLNETCRNVKDYGAVGDGVVDDTIKLKSLISSLLPDLPSKNNILFFPEGVYLVTDTLRLVQEGNGGFGLNVTGEDYRSTFIIADINKAVLSVSGEGNIPSGFEFQSSWIYQKSNH